MFLLQGAAGTHAVRHRVEQVEAATHKQHYTSTHESMMMKFYATSEHNCHTIALNHSYNALDQSFIYCIAEYLNSWC